MERRVIFLDRDGVLNKKAPDGDYVKKWKEFVFLPGSIDAIKLLNDYGYLIYVISNQAGIAKGLMSEEDLNTIHQKMEEELKKHGVKIDGVYYCPHSRDDECECRKPKPGMLLQASRDHHIDLARTIFIGDSISDAEAGRAAGVKFIPMQQDGNLFELIKQLKL